MMTNTDYSNINDGAQIFISEQLKLVVKDGSVFRHYQRWTQNETATVLDFSLSNEELSVMLARTPKAIASKRAALLSKERNN
jgi:hypothetical protein